MLDQVVAKSIARPRFNTLLLAIFAGVALLLASVGIYGVMNYSATQRTQEIGIRMALGATAPQVQLGVIARALRLTLIGIALGTLGSVAAARWIAPLLFGTKPSDPVTFAGIVVLLGVVAFVAGYIPARRASHIDPMIALRTS